MKAGQCAALLGCLLSIAACTSRMPDPAGAGKAPGAQTGQRVPSDAVPTGTTRPTQASRSVKDLTRELEAKQKARYLTPGATAAPSPAIKPNLTVFRYSQRDEVLVDSHKMYSSTTYRISVQRRQADVQEVSFDEGDGRPVIETWLWSASRRQIISLKAGSQGTCRWEPPALALVLPIAAGNEWTSTSHCTTDGKERVQVSYAQTTSVQGHGFRSVGAYGRLEYWTLHTSADYQVGAEGNRTHITDDVDYSPSLLVPLRQVWMTQTFDGAEQRQITKTRSLMDN